MTTMHELTDAFVNALSPYAWTLGVTLGLKPATAADWYRQQQDQSRRPPVHSGPTLVKKSHDSEIRITPTRTIAPMNPSAPVDAYELTARPRAKQRPVSWNTAAITATHMPHASEHLIAVTITRFIDRLYRKALGERIRKPQFAHLRFPFVWSLHNVGTLPHVHLALAPRPHDVPDVQALVKPVAATMTWLQPRTEVTTLHSPDAWLFYIADPKKNTDGVVLHTNVPLNGTAPAIL